MQSDSLTILCVSSGGFSAVNFTGGVGKVGSTMYIDDLVLEGPNGIQESLMPEVTIKSWPNPAKDQLNIEFSKPLMQGKMEILNSNGVPVKSISTSGTTARLVVSDLSCGTYYIRLMEHNQLFSTSSFVVNR